MSANPRKCKLTEHPWKVHKVCCHDGCRLAASSRCGMRMCGRHCANVGCSFHAQRRGLRVAPASNVGPAGRRHSLPAPTASPATAAIVLLSWLPHLRRWNLPLASLQGSLRPTAVHSPWAKPGTSHHGPACPTIGWTYLASVAECGGWLQSGRH